MIAPYSSIGPRIDGNPKMSVAAPGGWDVISAWSMNAPYPNWYTQGYSGLPLYALYGGYQLFGGTSAAGPHVAAAAALMLQLNDNCGSVAKDLIEASAYQDTYTGVLVSYPALGSPMWGYGKLNVCAAIEETSYLPLIHEVSLNPDKPEYSDNVYVTLNITNANSVTFDWSFTNWTTGHFSSLTLSGGLYNTTIPAHQYGQQIWYRINPVNSSAIANPSVFGTYVVGDTVAPIINSLMHNATTLVFDPTWIDVTVQVSEPVNASGVSSVVLQVTINNWMVWTNIPLTFNGTHYLGTIAPYPVPLVVKFRVVVTDFATNSVTSADVTYNVVSSTTTTWTTTTTATTTTGTSIADWLQDNLYLVIGVGGVVLILIVICIKRR